MHDTFPLRPVLRFSRPASGGHVAEFRWNPACETAQSIGQPPIRLFVLADAATNAKMNLMMIPPVAAASALGRDIRETNVSADLPVTKMLRAEFTDKHTRKRLGAIRC